MTATWTVRGRTVTLEQPLVMGIVNVTPDSFSDGGYYFSPSAALAHAAKLLAEGADILDIGGESTRPQGAMPVGVDDELRRVLPAVQSTIADFPGILVSVDTVKARVAAEALGAGASIVNDVSAFRLDPEMAKVCARGRSGVVLMHSRGDVADMATFVHAGYGADAVGEVIAELSTRVASAVDAGVERTRIVIDPGIGFSKRGEQSLAMLAQMRRFTQLGFPVLVGVSRKRFIGEITRAASPADRMAGTVGANVVALERGARLFRVHDVKPSRDALDIAWAIMQSASL